MTFKAIRLNAKDAYNAGYASVTDTYGGSNLDINLDDKMIDDLIWLRKFRAETDLERKLRDENPALQSAYDQYQTMLNLLLDTH